MHLASISADVPFLDTLAARWLAEGADPGEGRILLPTRRAARALGEAFLRVADGRPMLLPRIDAIGALDDESFALGAGFGSAAMRLPQAVHPLRRQAVLSRLVSARETASGRALAPDLAWEMAGELARLIDESQRAGVDLGASLHAALGEGFAADFAEHWRITLDFLDIITRFWPTWLAEQGLMDPVARQMAALRLRAEAWTDTPPAQRVIGAGVSVTNPASLSLLSAIARAPNGLVVLSGLDTTLSERDWGALGDTHPQADLRRLLEGLGARRADVRVWNAGTTLFEAVPIESRAVPAGRPALLSQTMLPESGLAAWLGEADKADLTGLSRLEPLDAEEEAQAIALALRSALDTPGRRAALITPDRALAARVSTALARWSVHVEDSAGEPLAATPPAIFLRLLLAAVDEAFAPVSLLALLKHPLTALGLEAAECRARARRLEVACLRGGRPGPGIAGLRTALSASTRPDGTDLLDLLDRLEHGVAPLAGLDRLSVPDLIGALIEAAERSAIGGPGGLWSGEEGAALSDALAGLLVETAELPLMRPRELARFLDAALAPVMVRTRRALRGRGIDSEHPRLFIWGLLEARLQSVDVAVLAGLGEGVWPAASDPGPWLSRPMRTALGLDSPERAIGTAAADFVASACSAPEVILSAPRRREGAPLVPSRWLVRLDAYLQGRDQSVPAHPALGWARALDRPRDGISRPVDPPRPCPPLSRRPRQLSVTEIDTLKSDPYAIHARHVLRLRKLDPPEQSADHADFGRIVHAGLARVLRDAPRVAGLMATSEAPAALEAAFADALEAELVDNIRVSPVLVAWWRPRLRRIAAWVAAAEVKWRESLGITRTEVEKTGKVTFTPEGATAPFTLTGRADRLDLTRDGGLAVLDYKTGTVPKSDDVTAGWMSQLPLEAAMAMRGGFDTLSPNKIDRIAYWKLSGGAKAGDQSILKGDAGEIAEAAWAGLAQLVADYDDPARPYLSHPRPTREPRYADYRQLARHAEWVAAIGEDEG